MVVKGLYLIKEEIMINMRAEKAISVHSVQPPLFTDKKTKTKIEYS